MVGHIIRVLGRCAVVDLVGAMGQAPPGRRHRLRMAGAPGARNEGVERFVDLIEKTGCLAVGDVAPGHVLAQAGPTAGLEGCAPWSSRAERW